MKVVLDTNVVLDVLASREPFYQHSSQCLMLVASGNIQGAITANSVTDIAYLLRKHLDPENVKPTLARLLEVVDVVSVDQKCCFEAIESAIPDFEDALLDACAKRWGSDFVITRDVLGFEQSSVAVLAPRAFLEHIDAP